MFDVLDDSKGNVRVLITLTTAMQPRYNQDTNDVISQGRHHRFNVMTQKVGQIMAESKLVLGKTKKEKRNVLITLAAINFISLSRGRGGISLWHHHVYWYFC